MSEPDKIQQSSEIYVGRQPIFDQQLNVVAYELLYRNHHASNAASVTDGELATTQVLINTFTEIGFDNLVGENKAFVNMPRGYIIGERTLSLPSERIVLEILEDVKIDDEVVNAVRNLSKQGFIIALDDFVYHESLKPLVEIADIIKIDLMALNDDDLEEHVQLLLQHDVELLAEKVETQEEYENCKRLGFHYFQGYFFSKPQIVKSGKLPNNRMSVLQLIAKIYETEVTYEEIDKVISQDVSLSYKLLRIINSAAYSLPRKIESMKHALTILGLKHIRNWISMIAFSGVDDKPNELLHSTMVRGKMCELLSQEIGLKDADASFTVGLFSNLDALMDRSLSELIAPLPLSKEIKLALLEFSGSRGEILSAVLAYEKGDWDKVQITNLSTRQIKEAYLSALLWADEISRELR